MNKWKPKIKKEFNNIVDAISEENKSMESKAKREAAYYARNSAWHSTGLPVNYIKAISNYNITLEEALKAEKELKKLVGIGNGFIKKLKEISEDKIELWNKTFKKSFKSSYEDMLKRYKDEPKRKIFSKYLTEFSTGRGWYKLPNKDKKVRFEEANNYIKENILNN